MCNSSNICLSCSTQSMNLFRGYFSSRKPFNLSLVLLVNPCQIFLLIVLSRLRHFSLSNLVSNIVYLQMNRLVNDCGLSIQFDSSSS